MIGAPRAQSDIPEQENNNETGAVYKCHIGNEHCYPYYVDKSGDYLLNASKFIELKKDNQWLGSVMDGYGAESDKFIVCAKNAITVMLNIEKKDDYLYNGLCYEDKNTLEYSPGKVSAKTLKLLQNSDYQIIKPDKDKDSVAYLKYGQLGHSIHILKNSTKVLFGVPGIFNWRGSFVLYDYSRNIHKNTLIGNPQNFTQENSSSYFGYSVTAGKFDITKSDKTWYVASAPRGNNCTGEVYIFEVVSTARPMKSNITVKAKINGHVIGEYFGYSLLAEDFNNDGISELVVSAPFYAHVDSYDNGKVYVYKNEGTNKFVTTLELITDYKDNGRFGMALGKIGDIDNDGYNGKDFI